MGLWLTGVFGAGADDTGAWGPAKQVEISDHAIVIDGPGWYKVETEGGAASSDLHRISGLRAGEEILITLANADHHVVLKNGEGNINFGSGFLGSGDVTLKKAKHMIRLFYDGSEITEAKTRP